MRIEDAPRAGWYPDPENRSLLRWWDGLDWTEARRTSFDAHAQSGPGHFSGMPVVTPAIPGAPGQALTQQQVIEAARQAARAEVDTARHAVRGEIDRAADLFTARARAVQRDITPMISTYTNRIVRWIRALLVIAVLIFIAWLAFQVFAQASLFNWIGDRIDNWVDDSSAATAVLLE